MRNSKIFYSVTIVFLVSFSAFCQQRINLADQFKNNEIEAINKDIHPYKDHPEAIEMHAANSSGIGIIKDLEFKNGIIEIDLLGENNPGKSFIGIAFNIQNEETYEAIYFRPFNFVATEQIRKDHMVQYIYHPEYTWRKLREEKTGEFEDEILNPPDPDDWFKAVIHIKKTKVVVYVNDIPEPVLSVNRLASPVSKKIGVWTGYGSSGRFKSLVIK